MAGNYLIRNSAKTVQFLIDWANYEFLAPGAPTYIENDQGPLHLHIVKTLLPECKVCASKLADCLTKSRSSPITKYADFYGEAAKILKIHRQDISKAAKLKIKIFHRAQGFARDFDILYRKFKDLDFMNHQVRGPKFLPLQGPFKYSEKGEFMTDEVSCLTRQPHKFFPKLP